MSRVTRRFRSVLARTLWPSATYEGEGGTVWFAGLEPRARTIASYFAGDEVQVSNGRILRHRIPDRVADIGRGGGLPIVSLREPEPRFADIMQRAIAVPAMVDIHVDLPPDSDTLRAQLLTSTTREDFRRIRKAGFDYRITGDPEAVREFHRRHYTPNVEHQYPDDGQIRPVGKMIRDLDRGGELVCADIDGDWVAGIFNIPRRDRYALMTLGIRDGDIAIRQKRVVAALIVRSLERAVELGYSRATLGRSLPFLGKGPVWFKAKWSGNLTRDPATPDLNMFMDLRHAAVRRMLSDTPVIHREGDELVASAWLAPGEKPLETTIREAGRFSGISRWYVLGDPATLNDASSELDTSEGIVPVPVAPSGDMPLWLGETLPLDSLDPAGRKFK